MDPSTGQPPISEASQVRVNFTTTSPELQLPEEKSQLLVPADIKRYGLSRVLNSEAMLGTPAPIPFDFLINGSFLRTSLEDYLRANGLSSETAITLQYVRSLIPPIFQASLEHDDWVRDVDVLSQSSRAGVWSGGNYATGQAKILSASDDGLLRIWDMSCRLIATSPSGSQGGHTADVKSAKFLSSSQIASAGDDRTVRVWEYTEADDHLSGLLKPSLELRGHGDWVVSIDVNGATGRILSASMDGCVGLWTTSKASAPAVPEDPSARAAGGNIAKKRKTSSSGNAAPQRGPLSLMNIHTQAVQAVAFDPNDSTVAYSAGMDQTIRTIDLTTERVVHKIPTSHPLFSLCPLRRAGDGVLLAAGTMARHITLVDPRMSATTTSVLTLRGHKNWISCLSASPENDYSLVSGSYDSTCRIWDLRSVRAGTKTEGGGSVSESVYVIERESQKKSKREKSDTPGLGAKLFGVAWDAEFGIVSAGEDKQVQINRGRDLLAPNEASTTTTAPG